MAARTAGDDVVALAFCGDGGTSEGDFHEALNFAGVFHAPVVFLVQNNHYAISVPFSRQTNAPSIAHKGVGHGVASARVDGNDVLAVHTVVSAAVERARRGEGPTVVEALTYRMEPHTTADDAARYRTDEERERWLALDPLLRFDTFLTAHGLLDDEARAAAERGCEERGRDVPRRALRRAIRRPPRDLPARLRGPAAGPARAARAPDRGARPTPRLSSRASG